MKQARSGSVSGPALLITLTAAVVLIAPSAQADLVHLLNGQTLRGIVVQQTPQSVRLQVAWQGYITVSAETVASIQHEEETIHKQLLSVWQAEHDNTLEDKAGHEAQREALRATAESMHEKEKLKAELEALKTAMDIQSKQHQAEIAALKSRLGTLEVENEALARNRQMNNALAMPLIIGQDHDRREDVRFFRDAQGNILHVEERNGRQCVRAPDGKLLPIQSRGFEKTYVNEQGRRVEIKPYRMFKDEQGNLVRVEDRNGRKFVQVAGGMRRPVQRQGYRMSYTNENGKRLRIKPYHP